MNTSGWLQLGLYVVVLLLLAKPLGAYMAAVYEGRATLGTAHRRTAGAIDLSRRGRRPGARNGLDRVRARHALVQPVGWPVRLRPAAGPAMAAAQPADHGRRLAGLGVQHRDELHHQHQLARLCRREHDELPDPDAGARGAELRFGRERDGGAGRADSRLRPQGSERHRQLLDGPRPFHGLHPAAVVDRVCGRAGEPGRRADLRQGRHGHAGAARHLRQSEERPGRATAQGRKGQSGHRKGDRHRADDPARAGRVADRDQAARHQRRRLLQRQFRAPAGKPDAAVQFPRDARDPADPGGAVLHVRQDDPRHPPGLGPARGDDAGLRRAAGGRLCARSARQPGADQARCRPGRDRHQSRRQHGRQGTALRRRQLRRCGRSPPPPRRTARSTRCTTRSCRSRE